MAPTVEQRGLVEFANHGLDVRQFEQPRSARDQQPQRQLHWCDVFHQVQIHQQLEQLTIRFSRGPGRERNKGGRERETQRPELVRHLNEVGARMPFVELREHRVVHRFGRAGDEQAAGLAEEREQFAML